jgi:8-hydroxy-5-deazaflavin:NADPH oxidoreductase
MTIGIIGAGAVGGAFARRLAAAKVPGIISNRRGPESLTGLIADTGGSIRAGTKEEAALLEMVLVAVNWSKLPSALSGLPNFGGRVVIDANNPIEAPTFQPAELAGRLLSELFSDYVPGARVVKAFNHLPAKLLAQDPRAATGRRVLFFSGSDALANAKVAELIDRLGFYGIDLGRLSDGGCAMSIPGGGLATLNLVRLD